MTKIDYQIAIPSYKRQNTLITQTLATVRRYGADMSRVTVFVADREEEKIYRTAMDAVGFEMVPIVVGVLKLGRQRMFIDSYYEKGTRLLSIDDDLADLVEKVNDKKMQPLSCSLDELVAQGFALCEEHGAKLWSVYPVANAMFMKDWASVGLKFCYGCFHGSYAGYQEIGPDDPELICHAEDWERMFRSYRKYGKVVRIEWVATKSKFFAQGGMMEEAGGKEKRLLINNENIARVAAENAEFCSVKEKAGGILNIRLKVGKGIPSLKVPR